MDESQKIAAMKSVYDIIMQLRKASGTNAKKDILETNRDNQTLKTFLYHVYEPTISYYQTKILPRSSPFDIIAVEPTYDVIDDIIYHLAERTVTGHEAIHYLGSIYDAIQEKWMRELLEMLIARDIKASIKIKTINKVWPNLITDRPYMRCSGLADVNILTWPFDRGVDSEVKYDGTYANIFIYFEHRENDKVESRNGSIYLNKPFQQILGYLHQNALSLRDAYPQFFLNEDYVVFNGELEMLDPKGQLMPRAKGNGRFNSLLQTGEAEIGYTPQYKIWDFVPGTKFEEGLFNLPRRQRRAALDRCVVFAGGVVELGECRTVYNYADALADYKAKRARKLEGTILKHPDGPWENKTSSYQVKVKNESMIDVEWVKVNPGTGKNASLFGSVTFKSRDNLFDVDVTGFSDDLRKILYDLRNELPGTIHTIIINELTEPTKSGQKWSAFLPRYDHQRLDKTEADSLEEIRKIVEGTMKD